MFISLSILNLVGYTNNIQSEINIKLEQTNLDRVIILANVME